MKSVATELTELVNANVADQATRDRIGSLIGLLGAAATGASELVVQIMEKQSCSMQTIIPLDMVLQNIFRVDPEGVARREECLAAMMADPEAVRLMRGEANPNPTKH